MAVQLRVPELHETLPGAAHPLHDLRDTHASLLAKAGVPIEVISKRLGHSDVSITYDRYITVYRDRDAEAAEAFGKIVT